ncbi:hypothetical protein EJB05_48322, partial [Eragrostis curvula]
MASTCGGGGGRGGRSPLSRRRLDLFTCVLACSFFGAARGRQLQQPPPPLEVRTYSYASFEAGGLRESRDLKLSPDARINSGALQLTPDTRNNPSYLVNKSGSILLRQPFVLWRLENDGGDAAAAAPPARNGSNSTSGAQQQQAPRARVVSFNSTFSMNVFYDQARPGEGLTFLIAPSLDDPPPGSHGGKLRAKRSMERRQEMLGHTLSNLPGMPREFTYEKLRKATKNFDERQQLGKGGYGKVYKGLLPAVDASPEGMEVAVKMFTREDARVVDDFLAEVDIINRLRHKNIVPLIVDVPTEPLACFSGRRAVNHMHGRGALLGAVDQHLGTTAFDADEANRLLLLGLACSSPNPADRPTMPQVLQILAKAAPPPEVPLFKPTFVWPPEGGTQFDLSDIGLTSSSAGAGNGGASSAMATQDITSFDSMQAYTAPNTTGDYFQALSTGR